MKDMQAFLGFANFYHYFIYNYSDIAILLIWLTQKNMPWNFDFSYYEAFELIICLQLSSQS